MITKVSFVSRPVAEKSIGNANAAIISIRSEDEDVARLSDKWGRKLFLLFHDAENARTSAAHGLKVFDEGNAIAILAFLEEIDREGISTVVVHCDGGLSRSAGVAKFIAEKYGCHFNHTYSLYNSLVYSTLKRVDHETRGS